MKLSEIIKEEKAGIITIYKQGIFVADDSFDVQDFLNWRKNVETESHKLNEDCIEKKLKD